MSHPCPACRRLLLAAAATALLAAGGSLAQVFPSGPIALIVPWPAGGATDHHLRGLAGPAGKHLGQNVIVENKPGGGGSTGIGSSPHLPMAELAENARVELTHVPFEGNGDLAQALPGGHAPAQSDASGWDNYVDAGQMRLLVTCGDKRTQRWPNVPTAEEPGGVVSTSPYGIVGPKGMHPAVVKTLHDAFRKAMDDPKHLELLASLNQDLWHKGSGDYAASARDTFAREERLIDKLGLGGK